MEYHVTPIGDLIEHEQDEDCPCGPEVEFVTGSSVYIHHSLDGRETEREVERA